MTEIIRFFYNRPRPFEVLENVVKLTDHTTGSSFPSGHAAVIFGLAGFLFLHNRKIGLWFLAAAVLIGIARVAVGVHYPSDILGGLTVGLVSAWIVGVCTSILAKYKNKYDI